MSGRFIALEGGEGCGKSTQAERLAHRLGAVSTREPGGTNLGAALRHLLLDPTTGGVDARAEALLMAADRAQHVAEVIRPALSSGRDVVTDRYIGSSLAYQGFGRGLPLDEVRHLSAWATHDLWPDLVVLLDVSPDVAAERLGRELDRFEGEDSAFHERVLVGFHSLAAEHPETWVVIDGRAGPDEVATAIWDAIIVRWPELA